MMQSMRSLIQSMTPTVSRRGRTNDPKAGNQKGDGTPDTAASSPDKHEPPISIPDLYLLLDTQLRVNIGTSVKCGICLCTLQTPIARTPCGHAFCHGCLLASWMAGKTKCPECQTLVKGGKRALQVECDGHLAELARLYKASLREFGFAPSVYQENFTTLTQKPPTDDDDDDDDDDNDKQLQRWHVAATWQQQALPQLQPTKLQLEENQLVVQANQQACQRAGYTTGTAAAANDHDDTMAADTTNLLALPNTQDILDEAREQQVADYELEDDDIVESSEGSGKSVRFQVMAPLASTVTTRRRQQHDSKPAAVQKSPIQEPAMASPVPHATTAAAVAAGSPFVAPWLSPIDKKTSLSPIMLEGDDDEEEDGKPKAVPDQDQATVKDTTATRSTGIQDICLDTVNDTVATGVAVDASAVANDQQDPKEDDNNNKATEPAVLFQGEPLAAALAAAASSSTAEPDLASLVAQDDSTVETKTDNKPRVSGLVEDSFGALHWTRRASLTLSSTQEDDDDDDQPPMTLTMTYDDPSRDYALYMAQVEAQEKNAQVEGTSSIMGGPDETTITDDKNVNHEKEEQDDSQETTVRQGGRPSLEAGELAQHEALTFDSDKTAPMDSSDEDADDFNVNNHDTGDDEEQEEDAKPSAQSTAATTTVIARDTTTASSTDSPTAASLTTTTTTSPANVAIRPTRPRARSEPTPRQTPRVTTEDATCTTFSVGDIVNVQARTWSGINKPGGVARITRVHPDGSYNVAYVLGGKESNVDSVFVSESEAATNSGKRKRRETAEAALPTALLQALAAEGYDTTGAVTWEQAQQAAACRPEVKSSVKANTKKSPKLKDVTNQSTSPQAADSEASSGAKKKTKRSTSTDRRKNIRGSKGKSKESDLAPTDADKKPKAAEKPQQKTGASTTSRKRKSSSGTSEATASKKKNRGSLPDAEDAPKSAQVTESPMISNEEAIQVADAKYKELWEDAIKNKVIQVTASALSEDDTAVLKALAGKVLTGDVTVKLSDNFNKKTTLCVMPLDTDPQSGISVTRMRTAKAMRATLSGIPIVSPAWVEASSEQNAPVLPTPEMLARSLPTKTDSIIASGEAHFGVARLAAHLAQKAPLPFENYYFFFCGTFSANIRKDLQVLVRDAGAKVLSNAAAVTAQLGKARVVLLCHDSPTGTIVPTPLAKEVYGALKSDASSVLVVNVQWISESITCAKALPAKDFAPVNAKAKELWLLGNQS